MPVFDTDASFNPDILKLMPGAQPVAAPPEMLTAGDGTKLATITNAARITGVSRRTVYNWISKGLVEIRLTPTGAKRVVVESLFRPQPDNAQKSSGQEQT